MDPSSPPHILPSLLLASLPALFAALFATASSAVASIPDARKLALRQNLSGSSQAALDRYLVDGAVIESRWLVLRVIGVATSALMMERVLAPNLGTERYAIALVGVLLSYGIPSEIGMVVMKSMADQAVPHILRLLRPFELLVAPIAAPFLLIGRFVGGLVQRKRPPSPSLAETEVEILVSKGEMSGAIAHDQSEMIKNVLDFGDVRAGDVMVPRIQVASIDIAMGGEDVLRFVAEKAHSRYPVFSERVDNVIGILHVKDLTNYAATHDLKDLSLEEVVRKPVVFVPESQTASSVLLDMRSGRHHMGIIIDEFGGMSGVITLEDIIEEIVGDIRDEHDIEDPPIVDLGDGRLMVDAGVAIADLSRYLGIDLPEDGDYNSLGGFIVERMGQVPSVGAVITDFGLDFVVRDADERHVSKVEIVRRAPGPESIPPSSSSRRSAA